MSTLLSDLAALEKVDSSAMDMLVFVQKHRAEIRRNAEDAQKWHAWQRRQVEMSDQLGGVADKMQTEDRAIAQHEREGK